jgi:hypothetical protein
MTRAACCAAAADRAGTAARAVPGLTCRRPDQVRINKI